MWRRSKSISSLFSGWKKRNISVIESTRNIPFTLFQKSHIFQLFDILPALSSPSLFSARISGGTDCSRFAFFLILLKSFQALLPLAIPKRSAWSFPCWKCAFLFVEKEIFQNLFTYGLGGYTKKSFSCKSGLHIFPLCKAAFRAHFSAMDALDTIFIFTWALCALEGRESNRERVK